MKGRTAEVVAQVDERVTNGEVQGVDVRVVDVQVDEADHEARVSVVE